MAKVDQTKVSETYERVKRQFVFACLAIAGGLGIAGSIDRSTGGVILLIGWISAVWSLHRLGRAGSSDRRKAR